MTNIKSNSSHIADSDSVFWNFFEPSLHITTRTQSQKTSAFGSMADGRFVESVGAAAADLGPLLTKQKI